MATEDRIHRLRERIRANEEQLNFEISPDTAGGAFFSDAAIAPELAEHKRQMCDLLRQLIADDKKALRDADADP